MAYEFVDDAGASAGRYELLPVDDTPASVSAGRAINSIPRQLGLTARYAIEGPAQALQVVTEPLRYFTDKLVPERSAGVTGLVTGQAAPPKSTPLGVQATKLADWIGLPKPETANERVVGDAARLLSGAAGGMGAARLASAAPGMVGTIGAGMAANPIQQIGAATGAGLAGGASREAGGSPLAQTGASLLGAVGGGMAPGAAGALADRVRQLTTQRMGPQQLDVQIQGLLERAGTNWAEVPENVRRGLRAELATSLQAGKELDPAAVRRLADFQTVGATPTRGMVSLDPVQITREQNLAKMAANSGDDGLRGLPMIQNRNNAALISRLNDLGAGRGVDPVTAGRSVVGSVTGQQAALRGAERSAWDAARASPGYQMPISPAPLNGIVRNLGQEGENVLGFLPQQITDYMATFQTGAQPFTPQHYRNLQSMLAKAANSADGNQAYAAGAASRMLRDADLVPLKMGAHIESGGLPITGATAASMRAADSAPAEAIDLVNQARRATRAAYAFEESSPMVRSVLSDGRSADPARIAQQFVLGGTADEARVVAQQVGPEGRAIIRDALANQIKQKALSGAADETGKVSQAALNRAINQIGEEKLRLFFSPEEVAQLRAAGRVASYIQAQPAGSAVNNSNSGALVLGRGMDLLNGVASKVPFGKQVVIDPARGIGLSLGERAAQNVTPGLLAPVPRREMGPALLLPGLAVGGGLLSPQ